MTLTEGHSFCIQSFLLCLTIWKSDSLSRATRIAWQEKFVKQMDMNNSQTFRWFIISYELFI